MDADRAQSIVVWLALSIGLASVVHCLLSATRAQPAAEDLDGEGQASGLAASLGADEAA